MDTQTTATFGKHGRLISRLADAFGQMKGRISALEDALRANARPHSPTEMIDAIPGRRIESAMVGEITFDATLAGKQGPPVTIQISQDGPFVSTHYPLVLWRPSAPSTATNLNRWRPVSTFPLPTQEVGQDIVDLMYQVIDGGAGRNFQNAPRGPMFSRPDAALPLPMPTLWAPAATIQFVPTYQAITWDGATPPTEGVLHVEFPGYRIVNL
jgi:hypothetical protein